MILTLSSGGRFMSEKEPKIGYKRIGELLVAGIPFRWPFDKENPRSFEKELDPRFEELRSQCGELISGPPMTYFDYGAGITSGVFVMPCFPVTQTVDSDEIICRHLRGGEVFTILHAGSTENLREDYFKVYGYMSERGLMIQNARREVYLEYSPEDADKKLTEVQIFLHNWQDIFLSNLERVLGASAEEEITEGLSGVDLEATKEERCQWLKSVLARLDEVADDEQKYEVLSPCADPFSDERIQELRNLYERTGDVDKVLEAMRSDKERWFEQPKREGNVILVGKNPVDPDNYEKAETEGERRMHYCHCPLVREKLDEGISPSHCYCGTGWYRQQWEGILGRPVRIEILKSVLQGDDSCRFAIHLPPDLVKD